MTQPNLNLISESLKVLAGELPNLQNLPVLTVMESLERTAKILERNSEQVSQITQNFSLALSTQEQRMMARSINATVRDSHAKIEPLLKNDGTLPNDYPRNFSEIQSSSEEAIKSLLLEYGQSIEGDVIACKKRLLSYLGIVVLYI
ncbi:hypothetical protein C1645_819425 [Glomus cerebriforme]|uniref:Uncharacterized protein n=1 Tax=Glomus cerebriforme TaxID=658196 RepID=A0A397T827_9GLOM|nr:hypothetical protein C1645_819425 [Glomus cerebriforme]